MLGTDRGILSFDREASVYPADLLDGFCASPSDRRWWVLYTKARQEKAIARDLLGWEIPYYLPLVEKTTVYPRHRFTSQVPLFTGYVFVYGSEDERVQSMKSNRISRVLAVHDPDRFCFDLGQLRRLIASDAPLTVERRLQPGNRVRVRRGAFAGLEGTVLVRRGRTRLIVAIDFLQQGASVEIEDFMLEPMD